MKISFIGAGSMAEAMIAGLIQKEICPAENVFVTNHSNKERITELHQRYGISSTYNMETLLHNTDIIIFAVKPKDASKALENIKPYLQKDAFFVSVMAGISLHFIAEKLELECAIARAMPNTSATIGKSATALVYNPFVSDEQKELANKVFAAIGMTAVVEEEQLDAITGLSGSGPAYIYYIVEAMEKAAQQNGIDKHIAKSLIIQTLLGAAEMLQTSDQDAAELRRLVTSPGGTTEAGINVLQQMGTEEAIIQCIQAAKEQSKALRHLHESSK